MSFGTLSADSGQAHKSWEHSHNDEVNIWQVYHNYSLDSLYNMDILVTFVKDTGCKNAASKCNMLYGNELQYPQPHICFSLTQPITYIKHHLYHRWITGQAQM